jgi:exodeoxyribonuclease-5/deoxyribonuclease V
LILAFDTYYYENKAKTVCVEFDEWTTLSPLKIYSEIREGVEDYIPGEFFKRELPCILSLIHQIDLNDVEAIIIDGYVYIDDTMKPGLGLHLYNALQQKIPVIGVAKTNFKTLDKLKLPLLRGSSLNSLFITTVGLDLHISSKNIAAMAGPHRIPALLKALDSLTKSS